MSGQSFPASYPQRGMWLSAQLVPGSYQLPMVFALPFRLTGERLRCALARIVERHETLRTAMIHDGNELTQVVYPPASIELAFTDLGGQPAAAKAGRLQELVAAEAGRCLDLSVAPLWRARAVRFDDDDWHLIFVSHHIVLDATSIIRLREELHILCRATDISTEPLPDLPIQYADFSVWQHQELTADHARADIAWWRQHLAGAPAEHSLPTARPRGPGQDQAGGQVAFRIGAESSGGIGARTEGGDAASPFMVLLAAFAATIGRVSGVDDVVIGTPVAGRDLPELAPLIGMFVNTLPIRIDLSGNPTFAELLGRVRSVLLDSWEHQGVPFDKLVEELAPERVPGRNPIFQLGFNLIAERGHSTDSAERRGMGFVNEDTGDITTRFDLHLDLSERDGDHLGLCEYSTALFDRDVVDTLMQRFVGVLRAGVAEPSTPLADLPVLTRSEQRAIAAALRPAGVDDRPEGSVLQRISAVGFDRRPFGGRTFGELANRAAGLSTALHSPVAIEPGDPDELAIGILAALRAGVPFLVLDPGLPPARAAFLLRDAKIDTVVTGGSAPPGMTPIDPDTMSSSAVPAGGGGPEPEPTDPDALAWILVSAGGGLPRRIGLSRQAVAAAVRAGPVDGPAVEAVPAVLAALMSDGAGGAGGVAGAGEPVGGPAGGSTAKSTAKSGSASESGSAAASAGRITFPECSGLGVTVTGAAAIVDPALGWWIRDAAGRIAVPGTPGELCLTGPAVALGYLDRPGPTAEAFDGTADTRSFRTGLPAVQLPGGQCRITRTTPKEKR